MDKQEAPAELRSMMAALDALALMDSGYDGLDWQVEYDAEYNKWDAYAKYNLTEITLTWHW